MPFRRLRYKESNWPRALSLVRRRFSSSKPLNSRFAVPYGCRLNRVDGSRFLRYSLLDHRKLLLRSRLRDSFLHYGGLGWCSFSLFLLRRCRDLLARVPGADTFAAFFDAAQRFFWAAAILARPSSLMTRLAAGLAAALPEPGGRPRRFPETSLSSFRVKGEIAVSESLKSCLAFCNLSISASID